jgi:hypothetical protein
MKTRLIFYFNFHGSSTTLIDEGKQFIIRQLFNVSLKYSVRGFDLLKPLEKIYWIRVTLSIIAGGISALVATFFDPNEFNTFLNGITVALAIYLISYYALKAKFANKVEKQSKIMSMGIFIYFIAWAVFFVLFYTILRPPVVS